MKEQEFLRAWMEKAKGNDDLDKDILEMIGENLEESLDEDSLLEAILDLTKAKADQNEAR